jgi:hypothetical protein
LLSIPKAVRRNSELAIYSLLRRHESKVWLSKSWLKYNALCTCFARAFWSAWDCAFSSSGQKLAYQSMANKEVIGDTITPSKTKANIHE